MRDLKEFMKDVRSVVKSEGNLREKYQTLAVEALTVYKEHGNSNFMAGLINEMGLKSRYRQSMLDYFKNHSPVQTEKDRKNMGTPSGDNAIKFKTRDGAKPADTDLETAQTVSFESAKRGGGTERAGKIFDEQDQLDRFIARHEKLADGEGSTKYSRIKRLPDEAMRLLRQANAIAKREALEAEIVEMNRQAEGNAN